MPVMREGGGRSESQALFEANGSFETQAPLAAAFSLSASAAES